MPKLRIDTKKSLYKPIEVEIDGKVFRVKRLTRDVLKDVEALDSEIGQGNLDATYRRIELLLGKSKSFDNLDVAQVGEIIKFIVESLTNPEKAEKNELGSGDKKSQQ